MRRETRSKVRRKPRRLEGERKRDATRRTLLERALKLFQQHGVEATTMRDIAAAAGMSLGAAYYYFPSKDALLFAYYEDNQDAVDELARTAGGSVRERLGALVHGKLRTIRPQRAMLASIIKHLVDPSDPLSAFSAQTRAVRERAIAVYVRALDGSGVPPELLPLVARGLWLLSLAFMLIYVNDDSPDESRTHGLVDDTLDLVVPMLPVFATPIGRNVAERVVAALLRAGIGPA